MPDANLIERIKRRSPLRDSRSFQPAQRSIAAHHDHIQHAGWEIPVHAAALGDVADQVALFVIRFTENQDLPGRGFDQAQNGLDQGCLACSVRSHDCHQRTGGDIHIHVP